MKLPTTIKLELISRTQAWTCLHVKRFDIASWSLLTTLVRVSARRVWFTGGNWTITRNETDRTDRRTFNCLSAIADWPVNSLIHAAECQLLSSRRVLPLDRPASFQHDVLRDRTRLSCCSQSDRRTDVTWTELATTCHTRSPSSHDHVTLLLFAGETQWKCRRVTVDWVVK